MLTTKNISNNLHAFGDTQLSCPVQIKQGVHSMGNDTALQYVCALLNSGGGILIMENMNKGKGVLPKHLDTWWSGMECNIASMLSQDDICHFVDFVGNFDDDFFFLFVKSAEHLCTIDFHCRLPTDTATHGVTYKSAVSLCVAKGKNRSLSLLPPIPSEFIYGETEKSLKQEGKQIQFKFLTVKDEPSAKSLAFRVVYYSSKYISAFANHAGGHIYFGIEDVHATVYGEQISEQEEKKTVNLLSKKMESIIWGNTRFRAVKGVHWDVNFYPLKQCPGSKSRKVIVVSVSKVYGGVFLSCPDSYFVDSYTNEDNNKIFQVQQYNFDEWKTQICNSSRDCPSLHSRFVKLPLLTPRSRLVFSLPHTLQSIREKIIKLNEGNNLQPANVLQSFPDPKVKDAVKTLIGTFANERHLVISLNSWGMNLPSPPSKLPEVQACLAFFSTLYGIHVVSLVSGDSHEEKLWSFTRYMATSLKQALVTHGGCNSHIGIKTSVLDINSPIMLQNFQYSIDLDIYPQIYQVREQTMELFLDALAIAIATYKPFSSDELSHDQYFLLTCDQLELLWTHQYTKELWVHGPPGSGKTVAALEMVREFRRRGCNADEVLYVAENSLLCSYIGSFNICMVCSRRELMNDTASQGLFSQKYQRVKNVIVDEAQNFKDRDGDWYSVLETLSKQHVKTSPSLTVGYFWLFMDYAQKVHKFKAGLPGLIGKNNFMLSEISRNCKEIFEYASKFMGKDGQEATVKDGQDKNLVQVPPTLGHQFSSGHEVSVVKCDKSAIHDMLFKMLQKFSDEGVDLNDMAILVSKKKDSKTVQDIIDQNPLIKHDENAVTKDLHMPPTTLTRQPDTYTSPNSVTEDEKYPNEEAGPSDSSDSKDTEMECEDDVNSNRTKFKSKPVVVSTVREFSGLDKPYVIGVEPHTNPEHANLDKLILNMATRARDSLVILTTSDELVEKLKPTE